MAPTADHDLLSKIDYYEFLGISHLATDAEIKKAGRKTSLKYHPDKVTPTPETLEKFHLLQIILQVLGDPAEKAQYDAQRDAKQRRKAEVDAMDAKRRTMVQDLEAREEAHRNNLSNGLGQKRTLSEREMKINRIAEDNRRKMAELAAKRRSEAEAEAAKQRAEDTKRAAEETSANPSKGVLEEEKEGSLENGSHDDLDRCLRVHWACQNDGADIDESYLKALDPQNIEEILQFKLKKRKVDGKGKIMMGSAVVMFSSVDSAREFRSRTRDPNLEAIELAGGEKK